MNSWTLQPVMPWWVIALAVAALIALVVWVRPSANLTVSRRLQLSFLRLMTVLLAATMLVRPGCIQKIEKSQSAVVVFLVDTSRSMELPHQADDSTRWKAVQEVIRANRDRIDALKSQDVDVRFYGFDNQLVPLTQEGEVVLPETPRGAETDIASAIYEISREVRSERLLGVFVMSDGVQNVAEPRMEISQAAESLADMQVPLFTVPFGLPGDGAQVADVAITSLPEQHRIAVKNELGVKATLVARGFANQEIPVQLLVADQEGNEQVVDTQIVRPAEANAQMQVVLRYVPTEPGEYRMRVRAEPLPGEVAIRNNELPSFLSVYEGGVRILYLSGNNAFWEQREIRNALRTAAQGFEVVFVPIQTDDRSRESWPLGGQITQLLADPTFDVIMIGDVDARALYDPRTQTENMGAILEQLDNGKGLIMLGGYHSFGPGLYHSTPLADVLPIRMDRSERQDFPPAPIRKEFHLSRELTLVPTGRHFITDVSDVAEGPEAWKPLTLKGANRFVGVKDTAQVLLETDSGQPILVAGRVGGRVLAFAGDTTWRWVLKGHKEEHRRFWRQVVLWLALKDGVEDDAVWIDLPQRRFAPLAYVSFETGVGTGEPAQNVDLQSRLVKPDGTTEPVAIVMDQGKFRGELDRDSIADSGLYRIEVIAIRDGEEIGKAIAEFVVFDRDREKAIANADYELLQRLASQTEPFGGRLVQPDDVAQVLDDLLANPKDMKVEIPLKWQLGDTPLDAGVFLLLFVTLLSTEWYLRKKWGLV